MSLNQQEMFTKLLEQIDMPMDTAFQAGAIDKLTVHQASKVWEFHLHFQHVLPYSQFMTFRNKLQIAFHEIAEVTMQIVTDDTEVDQRALADYWEWIVQNSGIKSPLVQSLCNSNVPTYEDGRVILLAENEVIQNFLNNTALGPIESTYQALGFPKFSVHTMIDESASQAKIEEFHAQKAKSDQELAKRAEAAIKKANEKRQQHADEPAVIDGPVQLGKQINPQEPAKQMVEITEEERSVIVEGYVFDMEVRVLRSQRQLLILKVTDYSSSMVIKKFSRNADDEAQFAALKPGMWVRARGSVQEDSFMRDLTINAYDINETSHASRQDKAPADEKRVELHVHSNMSTMDATNGISDFVKQAAKWGHPAVAITDHAGAQAFPEAFAAGEKNNIKILYGVEANMVDDGEPIAFNDAHYDLKESTYVVFDTETTGLSAIYDKVIELSAVKMVKGNVVEEFEEFIDPGFPLSATTTELTSITDDMVRGSKSEEEVFKLFREFCEGAIVVGHNVTFDMGFMNTGYARHNMGPIENPIIDTLTLARWLYPTFKGYRLNTLAKKFGVNLEHHHRAIYDAESTGHLNHIFLKDAEERYGVQFHDQLNDHMTDNAAYRHSRPFHATLYATTQAGLKNLFKIVSLSNVEYYYRVPRVPRSVLNKYRDGILVGSACANGEVFTAMMQKGVAEARQKAGYYDFLEVQPPAVYLPQIQSGLIADNQRAEEIIKNMVDLGHEMNIPVAATGDVHYLNPEDKIYRKILIHSQGGANPLNRTERPDVHFRTTDEMLKNFNFLGEATAHEIVVDTPQAIADRFEYVRPVKDKLYTPRMTGAEDEIESLTLDRAHAWYGDPLPDIVQARVDKELKSIIGNGFSVIYLIAQRLVFKSNKDGYLVGSRGSVGSSLVATLSGITEVNPMPPHYRCPKCQYSHFYTNNEYGSGYDLPPKACPECGTDMVRDGQNIPFETFLGFYGNKVPDIDLNFSGDYQPIAHNYTKVLFGEKNVYRAGTIGTVADKTGYGYAKAYERDTQQTLRTAEIDRLAKGITGVKRSTGQHPAGIIVVPDYMDIYDFTPVQYPADDQTAAWQTTHFDFHSIHDNILKIDILGHDDPTMIRMLQDLSGIKPESIPPVDPTVMKIFSSPEVLGVNEDQIFSKTGTLGIPEFGTRFVRGMLEETHPSTFNELLQISGLSHGTDVWLGNAEELIKDGTVTLAEVIGCRDNIMTDLIHYGMESDMSFQIMEHVRKGRGIPDEWQQAMKDSNVPDWYIDSCLKIKYMFPRAHAAAYILMALRVAYYKVYFPMIYYAAYFSVRADDFDLVAMSHGKEAVKASMKVITDKGMDASATEKNLLTVMELANEMLERGFKFKMVDLDKSDAANWTIEGDTLIAPFRAVPGLGLNVAKQIVAARADKPFLSKEDLSKRGKVSQKLIDFMTQNGVLQGLPDENQLSLF
ncbi:PolC-type DNA polymerase III [Lactiplantibacillus fabifermentans]|uniref:DNA polymerase III PolC-type n=2 Tax=Lactiplantibacillus fabifermentans TaxID=483011 RepID=A0A0R2NK28_9LACO|nr:PolC-type DNA polymerase III [Lactiplantibacillus fabifermentans]ETY74107.1 DNA polymerase III subunit alpha [Lactiplantibacillus fabifermentans T30PCM01]KRO25708.1 DNA polymerase III PolC [Lactiplantibacillus fabifermentans DSM 21115]